MSKSRECGLCPAPLGNAYIEVHDPEGISGRFHTDCYVGAYAAKQFEKRWPKAREAKAKLHADAHTLISER